MTPIRTTSPNLRRRLAIPAALSLTAAVLATGAASIAPAQAATPTCDGKPATIVFDGNNQKVDGTPGDDVMYVTGDSNIVDGKAGADTICYIGGSYSDDRLIRTGDDDDVEAGDPPAHDVVINTADRGDPRDGRYYDSLGRLSGGVSSGVTGLENDDDITTHGELAVLGYPTGSFKGTGPISAIELLVKGRTAYDIDPRAGTLTAGDHASASLSGFTDYFVDPRHWNSVRFRGTDTAETLTLDGAGPRPVKHVQSVDLRMGGGRDVVKTDIALAGLVSGGRGIDSWSIFRTAKRVNLSAPKGILAAHGVQVSIAGLEHYAFDAGRATVVGSNAPERFFIDMEHGTVDARGGNDRLFVTGADQIRGGDGDDVTFDRRDAGGSIFAGRTNDDVRGGRGNDRLHGGPGNDVLLGGPGKDYAVGGGNKGAADSYNDTCRAEKTLNCDVVL